MLWIKIWGSLSDREKNIVISMLDGDEFSWAYLSESTGYSTKTLSKYLKILQNKGIIAYRDNKYYIEDSMLKYWLKEEKLNYGIYP